MSAADREARSASDAPIDAAAVIVDGRVLFRVRGILSRPAQTRATAISKRIEALAKRYARTMPPVEIAQKPGLREITVAGEVIATLFEADAAVEGIDLNAVALADAARIRQAFSDYRRDRDPMRLRSAALDSTFATVALALSLLVLYLANRLLMSMLSARRPTSSDSHTIRSLQELRAQQLWTMLDVALRVARVSAVISLAHLYARFVLEQFPWTRELSLRLHDSISEPLAALGRELLAQIPNLVLLAVLATIARYALRLSKALFTAIGNGSLFVRNFEPEWALPTYRITRLSVHVITAIVAYPYIPGSNSEAFKAISVFLGVMISLGSSSLLSNLIAGYAITYRRTFKVGDRVRINDSFGEVIEVRLQVTHLRSLKNEELIIPNSLILNSQVTNYSSLARTHGLILHTNVGIGYETPWRQVEAMLIMAARRTAGLLRHPEPFVLQRELANFAVVYELNVYCEHAALILDLYAALHRNILDVFNEYGVQIMTPAYQRDPATPKIVPKDQWFVAPAEPGAAVCAKN